MYYVYYSYFTYYISIYYLLYLLYLYCIYCISYGYYTIKNSICFYILHILCTLIYCVLYMLYTNNIQYIYIMNNIYIYLFIYLLLYILYNHLPIPPHPTGHTMMGLWLGGILTRKHQKHHDHPLGVWGWSEDDWYSLLYQIFIHIFGYWTGWSCQMEPANFQRHLNRVCLSMTVWVMKISYWETSTPKTGFRSQVLQFLMARMDWRMGQPLSIIQICMYRKLSSHIYASHCQHIWCPFLAFFNVVFLESSPVWSFGFAFLSPFYTFCKITLQI